MRDINIIYPDILEKKDFKTINVNNIYISTIACIDYPRVLSLNWIDDLLNTDTESDISIMYEKQKSHQVLKELTYYISTSIVDLKFKDQYDVDILASSSNDARHIRREIQVNGEQLYRISIYMTLRSDNRDELVKKVSDISNKLRGKGIFTKQLYFRQLEGYLMTLPLPIVFSSINKSVQRNILTKGLSTTYPFKTSELYDEFGILFGVSKNVNNIVMVYMFAGKNNHNMMIIGTSGSGKSYYIKLLVMRHSLNNIAQYIIDPEGEYVNLVEVDNDIDSDIFDSQLVNINIFDTIPFYHEINDMYLNNKVQEVLAFMMLLIDFTSEEVEMIVGIIYDMYKSWMKDLKKIYESKSLELNYIMLKDMPKFDDLEEYIESISKKEENLKIMEKVIKFSKGNYKMFNTFTSIGQYNKIKIFNLSRIDKKLLPPVTFLIMTFIWNSIRLKNHGGGSSKSLIYIDEIWRIIRSGENEYIKGYICDMFRTIRKYNAGIIAISQDIGDFIDDRQFGETIFANSNAKAIFQIKDEKLTCLADVILLNNKDTRQIKLLNRGECVLIVNNIKVLLDIVSSDYEREYIEKGVT